MSIEYYLLYSINHFIKNTQESELTVVVDSVHFDPLRLAILGQKNELIEEIERGYHHEFSFPKSQILENDEQMLEKHAIFDSLLRLEIRKYRAFVDTPTVVINADTSAYYGEVFRIMKIAKKDTAKVVARIDQQMAVDSQQSIVHSLQ